MCWELCCSVSFLCLNVCDRRHDMIVFPSRFCNFRFIWRRQQLGAPSSEGGIFILDNFCTFVWSFYGVIRASFFYCHDPCCGCCCCCCCSCCCSLTPTCIAVADGAVAALVLAAHALLGTLFHHLSPLSPSHWHFLGLLLLASLNAHPR
jgi:hypothetical protein